MQAQAQADDDAQGEHVLAGPLHFLGLVGDGILVVAACFPVLEGQNESEHEVQEHEYSQTAGRCHCIPVGAQHLANPVVAVLTDEGYDVHAGMERQEQDKCNASDGHHYLPAD